MFVAEIYEMSPYATFAMAAAPATRELSTATLDYTVQFKTFGHSENDSGIHQDHMPAGRSSKKHSRHVASSDGTDLLKNSSHDLVIKFTALYMRSDK
jgi:hypothetical protein